MTDPKEVRAFDGCLYRPTADAWKAKGDGGDRPGGAPATVVGDKGVLLAGTFAWWGADELEAVPREPVEAPASVTGSPWPGTAYAALTDLLAVIHRDGGHHTARVGVERSWKDAVEIAAAAVQVPDHKPLVHLIQNENGDVIKAFRNKGDAEDYRAEIQRRSDEDEKPERRYGTYTLKSVVPT